RNHPHPKSQIGRSPAVPCDTPHGPKNTTFHADIARQRAPSPRESKTMSTTNPLEEVWKEVSEVATAGLGKNAGMVVGVLRGSERRVAGYGVLDAGRQPPDGHSGFESRSVPKVFTTLV